MNFIQKPVTEIVANRTKRRDHNHIVFHLKLFYFMFDFFEHVESGNLTQNSFMDINFTLKLLN